MSRLSTLLIHAAVSAAASATPLGADTLTGAAPPRTEAPSADTLTRCDTITWRPSVIISGVEVLSTPAAIARSDSAALAGAFPDGVPQPLEAGIADTLAMAWPDSAAMPASSPVEVKVRDIKSIYCHPYSLTYNSPDWKRMWTNTAVLAGAYVGTLLVLECLPEDATAWNRDEIQSVPLFKRWYNHVCWWGPEWDHDNAVFNYVLHPYAGAAYFMAARSCGFNFWRSLLYSACISTIGWEFGIEAFMERPSIQDIFITPMVGSAIGELFYKGKRRIVANDYHLLGSKALGNIAVFLLDPVNEIVDLLRHRNTHCAGTVVTGTDDGNNDTSLHAPGAPRLSGRLAPLVTAQYTGFTLSLTF